MSMLWRLWDLAGLGTTAMKAILEFDMYEEKSAFDEAYNGTMYRAVLQELDEWLRRWSENLKEDEDIIGHTIGETRDNLAELLLDHNLTLYD